ncbi:exonuclease 3'-5' domain-containing protein 2-like isoform X2 [Amphiura filiformis]
MSSSGSMQLISVSALTISLTAALYLYQKTFRRAVPDNRKRKGLWDGHAIWRQMRQVLVVRNAEECVNATAKLRQATEKVKVLGLDCEWCSKSGKANSVALLQLAAANGLCVLIQLCHMQQIPQCLKDLLADKSILKVGVATLDDAVKLQRDYNITTFGCVDLRYMVVRHIRRDLRPHCHGAGLSRLAQILLNVTLNKSYRIRCSNWEAFHLSWQQMEYAIHDAFVAVAIFFEVINQKIKYNGHELDSIIWSSVVPLCQGIVDVKYKFNPKSKPNSETSPIIRGGGSGNRGSATKAYKARQSIMYHNCKLLAPDGTLLCTCDRKKAEWYIYKDIGVAECQEPFTVRLKFEPKGTPGPDRGYYLSEKENRCVVCGREDTYIRKNIVPHEYKKFFPEYLKNHASHDVLLLCLPCHQNSWLYDSTLRQTLVQEYNAPISSINSPMVADEAKSRVRSHAKGLLRHVKTKSLPEDRVKELEKTIRSYYQVEEVTKELLEEAAQIQTRKPNKEYTGSHGEKVVTAIMEKEGCTGLVKFERRWRQHFVDLMQPQFLPELWSIDHVHERVVGRLKDAQKGLVFDKTQSNFHS